MQPLPSLLYLSVDYNLVGPGKVGLCHPSDTHCAGTSTAIFLIRFSRWPPSCQRSTSKLTLACALGLGSLSQVCISSCTFHYFSGENSFVSTAPPASCPHIEKCAVTSCNKQCAHADLHSLLRDMSIPGAFAPEVTAKVQCFVKMRLQSELIAHQPSRQVLHPLTCLCHRF